MKASEGSRAPPGARVGVGALDQQASEVAGSDEEATQ